MVVYSIIVSYNNCANRYINCWSQYIPTYRILATRAQAKLTRAETLVGPGVDMPLIIRLVMSQYS